jgi:lipopolysaccharide export system protein LptC
MRAILVLGLLVLAGLSAWWTLGSWERRATSSDRAPAARHIPDAWFENATLVSMNARGTPAHRIEADRWVHFLDDDTAELTEPYMEFYSETGVRPPWQVEAETAWISSGGDLVLLRGEVFMHRDAYEGGTWINVESRDMRVRPKEDYAESDAMTVIQTEEWVKRGIGMRAWTEREQLQLLEQVKGRYEKKS